MKYDWSFSLGAHHSCIKTPHDDFGDDVDLNGYIPRNNWTIWPKARTMLNS